MRGKVSIIMFLLFAASFFNRAAGQKLHSKKHHHHYQQHADNNEEIIYHIFQRSFYDSNGDMQGDLNGVRMQLDYLQRLGVTAILLTPVYQSPFYDNYYAADFKKIDPAYGTMQDYLMLVKEVHKRGMKLYLEMEPQYVTEDHIWWKNSFDNIYSPYSEYVLFGDNVQTRSTGISPGTDGLLGYDSVYRKITLVNLFNPKVQEYYNQLFKFWIDPNNDGDFDDGVDGFQLNNMSDNLDSKQSDLFAKFWLPLTQDLKQVNPNLKIIAEQADTGSFGLDYFKNAVADRVFAFRMEAAIRSFDKDQIIEAADSTFLTTPPNRKQLIFIESPNMSRFSYGVDGTMGKLRVGAALNLLLGGVPSIYYGQELGMTGAPQSFGQTDANDIPDRSAFEWNKSDRGKGMALWYKLKGPWRNTFNNDIPDDGISLEEEQGIPGSLFNFYRQMIGIRKANSEITNGNYLTLENDNDNIFTFMRYVGSRKIIIAVNLADDIEETDLTGFDNKYLKVLYGFFKPAITGNTLTVRLPAYGVEVIKM